MDINSLLKKGVNIIGEMEYGNPHLEAVLVLAKLLKVDKVYIYIHGEKEVEPEIEQEFIKLMEKRATGYPIQYILNEKEFMGLDFYIEEGVLIPRPDTEILVEYLLTFIDEKYDKRPINLLDLGFGSGAIALSVAYYRKNVNVYGVDVGDIPMKVACINKDRFNLNNVKLYKGDLFHGIEGLGMEGKFHIIASNPPYISDEEIKKLQREVKEYEPIEALSGGEDGLDYFRKIIPKSKDYLCPQGLLILEIGYNQEKAVKDMFVKEEFKDIEILKDLQGLDRVVLGTK
ncbi:release factor glutamine methyltransferase [Keratinibaculum paraultunense]|uniref:Release factor glutamine methyltransferase n=1 Tax=Keratinibaculum paraultunense TaxID=1278232 RepID=A0A4R3KW11_9FIRM|nr:peptide chain release factor N(5)-glutamine methyltransferase [Keratinibaculum paraultunense]QQY79195.1 peptide chain release factor N(5)-glutamine methyltransferase [Keratinibaculum paraultunense]TCS88579.1 release factor glutamine methyltransferase [Keratinibaculum paraultunense]